jgi:hypothetical protein
MTVAVLGSGPAGLAAALAAANSGHRVLIATDSYDPSKQYGCQYLHAPMPGYEQVAHTTVDYSLIGTPEEYRLKVYGPKWEGRVSPEDFVGQHEAWDIRATYNYLWDDLHMSSMVRFEIINRIHNGILPDDIYDFKPSFIISTIPAPALCFVPDHHFTAHRIFASGSRAIEENQKDQIICDGTQENEWYRSACVFGYRTTEWSYRPSNGYDVSAVTKPLITDCDCYPEIHRVGRYGKWQKSYLVHQVYPEVMEILS